MEIGKRTLLAAGLGATVLASHRALAADTAGRAPAGLAEVKAILFDLFGSVVDWRRSVARELAAWGGLQNVRMDWAKLVPDWYAAYTAMTDDVRMGRQPWAGFEQLMAAALGRAHPAADLTEAQKADMVMAWRRADPWPDAIPGLTRLKARYVIGPLANASVPALLFMAKRAGLPWDNAFSGQYLGHYAPDPQAYLGAAQLLQLKPAEVMLVSAHSGELDVAKATGFKAAFLLRPRESGTHAPDRAFLSAHRFDITAPDIGDLARQMGA